MIDKARESVLKNTRWVPDFPVEGVKFADLSPVLADASSFQSIIDMVACWAAEADLIAGLDARGFLIASGVAIKNETGVLAVRKRGKLPPPVHTVAYDLEYGTAALEIPADGIELKNKRVFIADDVLATGGTAKAAVSLIQEAGGEVVGVATILELQELSGREQLPGVPVFSIVTA